ncbi:hypothetical protein CGA22_10905 [Pseudomonas sp. PSB18]|nr:hypothetical protein [Pseudomonas sp. PSB18]
MLAMTCVHSIKMLTDTPSSRASSAPTRDPGRHTDFRSQQFPVGASLLAMTGCQSTSVLNVSPPSRAGSLPQGISTGLYQGKVMARDRMNFSSPYAFA